MSFGLALLGATPALFLMGVVDKMDAKRPEPRSLLRKVAIWGGVSTLPCALVEAVLQYFGPHVGVAKALFMGFLVAGVVEESAKALCLYLVVWKKPDFDERLDGIVYATRAGLGFALVENVCYLLGTHGTGGFIGMFIGRAVLAVPGHAIFAGFMGYWAARKRFDGVGPGLFGGLLMAIFLHGSFDASIFLAAVVGHRMPLVALGLLAVPLVVVIGGYRRLKKHAHEARQLDDEAFAPPEPPKLRPGMGFVLH